MTDERGTEDTITVNTKQLAQDLEDAVQEAVKEAVKKAFDEGCAATVARMVVLAPDMHRSTVKALGERVLKEVHGVEVITVPMTPTAPDVAVKRPVEPLQAGEEMHYWNTGGFIRQGFLCDVDAGFRTSSMVNVTCPGCLTVLGLNAEAEDDGGTESTNSTPHRDCITCGELERQKDLFDASAHPGDEDARRAVLASRYEEHITRDHAPSVVIEGPAPQETQANRGNNNSSRCPGCDNCDQWPCVCS